MGKRYHTQKDVWTARAKRCYTSYAIREVKTKTTMIPLHAYQNIPYPEH